MAFPKKEFDTPQEALLDVFADLLECGYSHSYGIKYIWVKDGKFYTEVGGNYHSAESWRMLGFTTYDIVEIKNYTRTYYDNTQKEELTGFMFKGEKFFKDGISYRKPKKPKHNNTHGSKQE